ncbi:hypothetical protein [Micromonospora sp. NPDC049679]|uniref:aromatic-ring hydroxylase C-terminal domain-containing protein n=1 Tax=Micromonospora sp. NPDC049679 TaxID=3155920 RepID=UPI0033CE7A0E
MEPQPWTAHDLRLHDLLHHPGFQLLLCGDTAAWDSSAVRGLAAGYGGLLTVHRVASTALSGPRHDQRVAQYLVRPDGHIAYRAAGTDLAGLDRYLATWLTPGRTG